MQQVYVEIGAVLRERHCDVFGPQGGGKIVGLNRVKDWPALTLLNPARLKWNLPHFVNYLYSRD